MTAHLDGPPVTTPGGLAYHLVVDRSAGKPVFVFLTKPPEADGYVGVPAAEVLFHPLPAADRLGGAARPVLGRARGRVDRYREFRSAAEREAAGFRPAGAYRVCDGWADYLDPWAVRTPPDQPTAGPEDESATE